MNPLKEQRNIRIRQQYAELKDSGLRYFDAIDKIYNSQENKQYCLAWDTIRQIISNKHYGDQK